MLMQAWEISFKRHFDLIGAILSLILAAPLILLLAAAIKITSRGPVFFVQERCGLNGRPFPMLKFRTMTTDTKVAVGTETLGGDSRITSIGRPLRRMGMDELPQLINVLRGEMSFVGPRPLLQWENDMCNQRQAKRLLVKPGITGLSQIKGRNAIPWHARIDWDVQYVEQASIRLDLWILWQTIPVVLRGANAYAPANCDIYGIRPHLSPHAGDKKP